MADLTSRLVLQPVADPPYAELVEHLVRRRFLGEQGDETLARAAAERMAERMRGRAAVLDVGPGAGLVWLVEQGDELAVAHLRLDDPALAPRVRERVEERARAAGASRLTVGVFPGDPVTGSFVEGGDFETAAVQMRLDLARALPPEDVVELQPMDAATWEAWMADGNETYAQERARSGESIERAREVAEQQMADLLPDGLATEHQDFFVGTVDGEPVGTLWVGTERPMAFVYDVVVDEAHRRRGYGAGLMRAGALWSRERGAHALGLNVFGYNHGARALYEGLGYDTVELYLAQRL